MNFLIRNCCFVSFILVNIQMAYAIVSQKELDEAILDFQLTGEGFHRDLKLSSFHLPSSLKDCSVLIKWTIPNGVYVDPYQLQNSIRNGTVHFSSQVNIEQMAHKAKPFVVHSLPDLECDSSCSFSQSIQLHSRYHLPSTDNFAWVFFPSPLTYFSCDCNSQPRDSWSKCVWQEFGKPQVLGHDIPVPVGDLSHSLLVSVVTIAVSFISTGYIAWVAIMR